jgi:pimeloyl-ACP methyl ester carboxylesterase
VTTACADVPPATTAAPARQLARDGAVLRFRDDGQGPPVLLLHGWTLDLEMWEPQVAALRTAFRLVRLDRRGFGLSTGRPALEHDVADLSALCQHLGLRRVALIGMSQGARAALAFAAASPERVSCLVLDGPPEVDSGIVEADVPLARLRALAQSEGLDAFRREWAAHPLARLRTADPGARRLLHAILGRYPGTDLLQSPAAVTSLHDPVRLESITVPALIVTGAEDLASRTRAAQTLARRLPHAEHVVVPDAGHLPNLDNPAAYNRHVGAFLARHCTEPT